MVEDKTDRDPRADARFAWALAAFGARAFEEAADLYEQAIELAPDWIGAHMALADAALACGDSARAAAALRLAARLDASDRHGACLALARLTEQGTPARAPAAYVAALFDHYAARFDTHLTQGLGYSGPADLLLGLGEAGFARADRALDLGCGTGLCGAALRPHVAWLAGVDLSSRMVAGAAKKTDVDRPLYDRLAVGDLQAGLTAEPEHSLDLVIAADVFNYSGDLAPIFAAAERALRPGALLAFTVQTHTRPAPFIVGADLRFAHAPDAVASWLDAAGFATASMTQKSVRREKGRDVPGLVVVARRR